MGNIGNCLPVPTPIPTPSFGSPLLSSVRSGGTFATREGFVAQRVGVSEDSGRSDVECAIPSG